MANNNPTPIKIEVTNFAEFEQHLFRLSDCTTIDGTLTSGAYPLRISVTRGEESCDYLFGGSTIQVIRDCVREAEHCGYLRRSKLQVSQIRQAKREREAAQRKEKADKRRRVFDISIKVVLALLAPVIVAYIISYLSKDKTITHSLTAPATQKITP